MLVIDDFFANPMEVREQALKLTYPPTHKDDQYGGRTSKEVMLPPKSDQGFSQILREPVRGKIGYSARETSFLCLFQPASRRNSC